MTVVDETTFKRIYQKIKNDPFSCPSILYPLYGDKISYETLNAIYRLYWQRHVIQNSSKYTQSTFVENLYNRILSSADEHEIVRIASEIKMPPCFVARAILNVHCKRIHEDGNGPNGTGDDGSGVLGKMQGNMHDSTKSKVKEWMGDPLFIPNAHHSDNACSLSRMVQQAIINDDICSPRADAIKQQA